MSDSLRPHGLQHARPPYPSPTPRVYSNSCPLSGDTIQPSHPLSSPSSPAFNLSEHKSLFKWVSSSHQVGKVLEFQLQHQSFQWILRTDWLDLLAVQGTLKSSPTPQFKNINSWALNPSLWSSSHICTWLLETFQVYLSSHSWEPWGVTDRVMNYSQLGAFWGQTDISEWATWLKNGRVDQMGSKLKVRNKATSWETVSTFSQEEVGLWSPEPHFIGEKMRLQVVTTLQQVQSR